MTSWAERAEEREREYFLSNHVCPEEGSSCWMWTGNPSNHGYGYVGGGRRRTTAARYAWRFHRGPIPKGMAVKHSCGETLCVNPAHLSVSRMYKGIRTAKERFFEKVEKTEDGCWLWKGATNQGGYGKFWRGTKDWCVAHRFSYELIRGEVSKGLDLDHLCRVRNCVNPDHLEPVTRAENLRRARAYGEGG